jgi:hypothetical protein
MALSKLNSWAADSLVATLSVSTRLGPAYSDEEAAAIRANVVDSLVGGLRATGFLGVLPEVTQEGAVVIAKWTPARKSTLLGFGVGSAASGEYSESEVDAAWSATLIAIDALSSDWTQSSFTLESVGTVAGSATTPGPVESGADTVGNAVGKALAGALGPVLPLLVGTVVVIVLVLAVSKAKVSAPGGTGVSVG